MTLVHLEDVYLSFPVFHGASRSLKKTLFSRAKNAVVAPSKVGGNMTVADSSSGLVLVEALSGVTFDIHKGERVGLVGHNGAGKSTLLRVLGGIYETGRGVAQIEGDCHALIDPQSGMNPELTGRENLYLFAYRLGLPKEKIPVLEKEVEEFAELGPFFDLPLRLYSSGMGIRLGFALATIPRPQILLMDEWFMAGDQRFQDKARQRLEGMVGSADILVITSHTLSILREWCTRILWMEAGKIRMDGKVDDVLDAYEASLG
ncbi:ABC transporter ATP-binding protein [Swingsia samuiensis]|uniref:ABC transporter ATP-binding protein n=1 Tax=Swingsia samuiensis TaxID=1293412 RepID=A0A4Y6UJE0_9PROT|nr:ABC transporter ATP-binding protein [Swingsia samuiensis]QDH17174.1 ABC transporter ATP-binding protein [Swingsia samuiensis]